MRLLSEVDQQLNSICINYLLDENGCHWLQAGDMLANQSCI